MVTGVPSARSPRSLNVSVMSRPIAASGIVLGQWKSSVHAVLLTMQPPT